MRFKITKRRSKCDKHEFFYDLYVDGHWLCGFYDIRIIKIRKEMYKKRIPMGDLYESRKLFKKYHVSLYPTKRFLKKIGYGKI